MTASGRRVAVVTEAPGAGLGFTIARKLTEDGFDVAVLVHRVPGGLEEKRDSFPREAFGLVIGTDLTDPADVNRAKDRVAETIGSVDTLVNTASLCGEADVSSEWRYIVGAILDAAFNCCSAFVPGMIARGGGNIVNVFTPCSTGTHAHHAAIMAATAGVTGLTRALATDLGASGIAVNAVSSESLLGSRDDLAATICYLASPAARTISGEVLGMNSA